MPASRFLSGLNLNPASPAPGTSEPEDAVTEEAGLRPPSGRPLRIETLAQEDDVVAQGAPVARLRDAPEIRLVAPMPGRVARISLGPGHVLSEIVLFHETRGDVARHPVTDVHSDGGMRRLMQNAGIWPWLRRRPFGGMPGGNERPAAILVMAADTRPLAPDPRQAIAGREEAFERGLAALTILTDGPVFVCAQRGPPLIPSDPGRNRIRAVDCGPRHPQGLAGVRIHDIAPATIEAPVWDIHAEDVAALGGLLGTGIVPMTRLVTVTGEALRESRLVRTQPGADLRGLTHRILKPGANVLLSGSALDGRPARWLGPLHRQVNARPRQDAAGPPHWLVSALTRSARPKPVIPTAALVQAFGAALPAAAFVRALASGDDETAMGLGVLSFLEEDVALADYVTGGEAHLAGLLRGMLDRIRTELAA